MEKQINKLPPHCSVYDGVHVEQKKNFNFFLMETINPLKGKKNS